MMFFLFRARARPFVFSSQHEQRFVHAKQERNEIMISVFIVLYCRMIVWVYDNSDDDDESALHVQRFWRESRRARARVRDFQRSFYSFNTEKKK